MKTIHISAFVFMLFIALTGCKDGKSTSGDTLSGNFDEFFKTNFVGKDNKAILASLKGMINPDKGVFLIHRPGSVDAIRNCASIDEVNERSSAFSDRLAMLDCAPVQKELPEFDCDQAFTVPGCFYQELQQSDAIAKKYQQLQQMDMSFPAEELADGEAADKITSAVVVITSANLELRFAKIDNKWYLILIDVAKFDCSA